MLINFTILKDIILTFPSKINTMLLNIICELLCIIFNLCVFICLLLMHLTGEDDSLALKKKVTVEDVFGGELRIHDPDAKWLSSE